MAMVTVMVNGGPVDPPPPTTNNAPVAADDAGTTSRRGKLRINALNNDTDPDGDKLKIVSVTQGEHGTVKINRRGTEVIYRASKANRNAGVPDALLYTVSDGNGGLATAMVSVNGGNIVEPPTPEPPTPEPPTPDPDSGGHGGHSPHGEMVGIDAHNFYDHAQALCGPEILAPGQKSDSGYEWVAPDRIQVYTKITGLRPAIEQAVLDAERAHPGLTGVAMEHAVAHHLRGLNSWPNLTPETQQVFRDEYGLHQSRHQLKKMGFNHVLHSPIPFGEPKEVLTPDITVDLDYPHTVDLDWTEVQDLGEGKFRIVIVSNNKNNSQTGHLLGSFVVQMDGRM